MRTAQGVRYLSFDLFVNERTAVSRTLRFALLLPVCMRVRFAPSPTGSLHIGGLRTALYNYLIARKTGGQFLLRIEDTDRERFVEGAEADIQDSLRWAGMDWDEGPDVGGPHGPYRQSERTERYREAVQRLLDTGHAYLAFDTKEELDAARAEAGDAFAYDAASRGSMRNSLSLGADESARLVAEGAPFVVRFKVPEAGAAVTFTDLVRGEVSIPLDRVDDQVLLKSDGFPTYHLANVVDDHAMAITHVIRGEEWLPSTPKHVLLYRSLGWEAPAFAHLSLILSPTGGKLSKRSADKLGIPVNVAQYREAGYEPEAVVNFLALLGWNPGDDRERFDLPGLVKAFSLERLGDAPVTFSLDKLAWFNGQVLRERAPEQLAEAALAAVQARHPHVTREDLVPVAALMRERLAFARDLATLDYFYADPEAYDEAGVAKRWKPEASAALVRAYADAVEAASVFNPETLEALLRQIAEAQGVKPSDLIHPVRIATTGTTAGASLFHTLEVLGKDTVLRRLRTAAEHLG